MLSGVVFRFLVEALQAFGGWLQALTLLDNEAGSECGCSRKARIAVYHLVFGYVSVMACSPRRSL